MRLFLAIELAPSLQKKIISSTHRLRNIVSGKWVEPNNLHITLAFIGEVKETTVPAIIKALTVTVNEEQPLDFTIGGLIGIPPRNPRVLALKVKVTSKFFMLQKKVIHQLKMLNISTQAHQPHLTLVRLRGQVPNLPQLKPLNLIYEVRHISLIQSQLTAKGPIYKRLRALNLGSGAPIAKLRPNIAICVINPKNEVLLVKHREHVKGYWQFPQGGVKTGDTLEKTVALELKEELGLNSFKLLKIKEKVYQYRWPKKLIKTGRDPEKKLYIGQEQSLAIVKVPENRPKLTPDPREAASTRWFVIPDVIKALNPIRRTMGKLAMVELKRMISNTK